MLARAGGGARAQGLMSRAGGPAAVLRAGGVIDRSAR
jgi:hypothetical protein